jgi:hypothetical protein
MYSVVANEIVDGGQPYVDAVERKPPLLFWTYAAVFKVAGKFNWKALHIVALVWTLGAMAGLYVIGSELFDRKTGLIAALFYGVFQSWWTWKTVAFDGEMLMNLPIIWAWAIAFRRSSSRLRPELLLAGALLGAAFLLKQPAAIAAIPLGIYLLLPSYRDTRSLTPTNSILQATMLTAGFVAVVGLVTIVIWKQGILPEAFYWTIADHDIPHVFWERGILLTLAFIGACLPLVVGAIMACLDQSAIWAERRAERTALFGLLVASTLGVAPIDPFARTAGGAVLRTTLVPDDRTAPLATTTFGDVCVAGSHCYCPLNRSLDGAGSATGPSEAGQYLSTHSALGDRIFVWGQTSKMYLEAQRRPASRYITTFPLTGYIFGGSVPGFDTRGRVLPGAWNTLERDFARHPPTYIIDVQSDTRTLQYQ